MQGALCRVSYFEERFLSQKSDTKTKIMVGCKILASAATYTKS